MNDIEELSGITNLFVLLDTYCSRFRIAYTPDQAVSKIRLSWTPKIYRTNKVFVHKSYYEASIDRSYSRGYLAHSCEYAYKELINSVEKAFLK